MLGVQPRRQLLGKGARVVRLLSHGPGARRGFAGPMDEQVLMDCPLVLGALIGFRTPSDSMDRIGYPINVRYRVGKSMSRRDGPHGGWGPDRPPSRSRRLAVELLDYAGDHLLGQPAGFEKPREMAAMAQLGDGQIVPASAVLPVAVTITFRVSLRWEQPAAAGFEGVSSPV